MTTLPEIKTKISKIKKSQMSQHTSIIETLKMIVEFLEGEKNPAFIADLDNNTIRPAEIIGAKEAIKKSFLEAKKEKKE